MSATVEPDKSDVIWPNAVTILLPVDYRDFLEIPVSRLLIVPLTEDAHVAWHRDASV
jgi:hypothetical protein